MAIRMSDQEFFTQHLDTSIDALSAIPAAAQAGDFAACRRILAAYVRTVMEPDRFFEQARIGTFAPRDVLIEMAEKACRHIVCSVGIEHDFGAQPVDWESNPTYNGYKEWTWQLSRHMELRMLAHAYRLTGENRYAAACEELFESWVNQAVTPPPCDGHDTKCWRTIECGIRQGFAWPEIIHSFVHAFSDDTLTDWCKSVCEHGLRLARDYTQANWLVMEMNGLTHIGVLYPFLKNAHKWLRQGLDILARELDAQIYPDGAQYELTTDYQYVVIINYARSMRLCRAYQIDLPPTLPALMEKMILLYVRLMRPDGITPSVNDGKHHVTAQIARDLLDLAPENATLRWAAFHEESAPAELSYVYEYPGLAALRTGWSAQDSYVFFDGGAFGRAHQHEDKLSLLLYADGKQILTEGNSYAYDDSEMRKYVCSTRAHNTALIDGMGQNRRRDYHWTGEIDKKSNLIHALTPDVDALSAVYDEGYGEDCIRCAVHRRNLYFVKRCGTLRPFVIVVDRFTSDAPHDYELMWHVDAKRLTLEGLNAQGDTLRLLVPATPMETACVEVTSGAQHPNWQGWTANTTVQKDFRPIPCVRHHVYAQNVRWVTVLYPDGGAACGVCSVSANRDIHETVIELTLHDGSTLHWDEKDHLSW